MNAGTAVPAAPSTLGMSGTNEAEPAGNCLKYPPSLRMQRNNRGIYHTRVKQGAALAWVNSYSAVAVKTPRAVLLFDPVSMTVPEDATLDLIAISHSHSDHWDPSLVARLQRRTRVSVAASPSLTRRLNGALPARGASTAAEMIPGDRLNVGDATVTALHCHHPATEPLSFLVRTADGVTIYLPGDTTPFPQMEQVPRQGPSAARAPDGEESRVRVDVLLWMGTALEDGARIAQQVAPKEFLTYAIEPPAAGARAKEILTRYCPNLPFRALKRHEVFLYAPAHR